MIPSGFVPGRVRKRILAAVSAVCRFQSVAYLIRPEMIWDAANIQNHVSVYTTQENSVAVFGPSSNEINMLTIKLTKKKWPGRKKVDFQYYIDFFLFASEICLYFPFKY